MANLSTSQTSEIVNSRILAAKKNLEAKADWSVVTQAAVTQAHRLNLSEIERLRNSPINYEMEGRQDRLERLAGFRVYVAAWSAMVTEHGFTLPGKVS